MRRYWRWRWQCRFFCCDLQIREIMSAFTLEDLKELPLKAHRVDVPEFGKDKVAYVAELAMDEREERITAWWDEYKKETKKTDDIGSNSWILTACLCDENRVFVCNDAMEVARASQKFGKLGPVSMRLFSKAMEVNALSAAAVEELEKN